MKRLRYEMATRRGPPTFDFYTWMVIGCAKDRPDEIVIDDQRVRWAKYPAENNPERYVRQRIESIILPGPALAGLPVRRGYEGEDYVGTYMMQELAKLGEFQRLKSVLPPATGIEFTVTLRNQRHNDYRNSDCDLWRLFAKEIGAVVIEDYEDDPIPLHERMALYAGAKMNFGVCNGPLFLLTLTDYPVTIFDCSANKKGWEGHGIAEETQLPWARDHQRLVWSRPTMDDLLEVTCG